MFAAIFHLSPKTCKKYFPSEHYYIIIICLFVCFFNRHVDTCHKLIRWRFIIAGGIDGFSRYIVYLKCIDNNKAETILQCFEQAVQQFGLPLRLRSDMGLENIKIAEFMINVRGPGKRTVIAGKSTHNQRIERLWRDVFDGVLSYFYDLFYHMEDQAILDASNAKHIYALHLIYADKINANLNLWREVWSRHRLRTAKSSPQRLFISGLVTCPVEIPISENEIDLYGSEGFINENLDVNDTEGGDSRPIFNSVEIQLSDACRNELDLILSTHTTFENHGIDLFVMVVDALERQQHGQWKVFWQCWTLCCPPLLFFLKAWVSAFYV